VTEYVAAATRRLVRARAQGRCEYCLIHEDDVLLPHEPDHIIASKHRGVTDKDNLAWTCFVCNRSNILNCEEPSPERIGIPGNADDSLMHPWWATMTEFNADVRALAQNRRHLGGSRLRAETEARTSGCRRVGARSVASGDVFPSVADTSAGPEGEGRRVIGQKN
jgi:hypothetical protein